MLINRLRYLMITWCFDMVTASGRIGIFQHPLIKEAKSARRGRVARLLSCNIALSARLDCFSGELSDRLQSKFQNDVNRLRGEKYGG